MSFSDFPNDILINEILPHMPLNKLSKLCQTDQRFRHLCQSELLWKNRINLEYSNNTLKLKPTELTYKQYYTFLLQADQVPVYRHGDILMRTLVTKDNKEYAINDIKRTVNSTNISLIFIGSGFNRDFLVGTVYSYETNELFDIFNVSKIRLILLIDGNIFEAAFDNPIFNLAFKANDYLKTDLISRKSVIPIYGFISSNRLNIIDLTSRPALIPLNFAPSLKYYNFNSLNDNAKYILGLKLGLIRFPREHFTEQMVIDKLTQLGHLFSEDLLNVLVNPLVY